jgi:DNA polymerase-3 subunit epsilon
MPIYPVYFDTETTGVDFEKDRIVEIAAYCPLNQKTFSSFVNPRMPIPKEATQIHHISDDMVKDAPTFDEVGKTFAEFCTEEALLIAHNNEAFDKIFIEKEFSRNSLTIPKWKYFDTLKWARKYRYDLPRHALQYLREVYGVESNQAHRALDDVLVLHQVFSQMIGDLTWEQVVALLQVPTKIIRMTFGKYQGQNLQSVPKNYIQWLDKSGALDKPENKDLKQNFANLGLL